MERGRLYALEGVVLARRDHGEADRIVVVLTAEGRVDLLAKGVRKPRSRKAGHLELFSRTRLLVSRVVSSWDIISQAEVVAVRRRLRADFRRATYEHYVAGLVLRFFGAEAEPTLYRLVDDVLQRLDEETASLSLLVRWYEHRLLELAGFRPEWRRCVGERAGKPCLAPLRPRPGDRHPYGVDPERGGALCPACAAAREGVMPVSAGALSWLQAIQQRPYEALRALPLPPARERELARVMEHYITFHLERRPAALRMLDVRR